jgi:thiol-disulfide isomerase/thioredoxin/tetratricopeptide (TPR) repeat protein
MGNAVAVTSLRSSAVLTLAVAIAAAGGGCRDGGSQEGRAGERRAAGSSGAAAAPAPAAPKTAEAPAARQVAIPWLSDDYAAALARARAEKKPIFIDMWAPWCHTCLSMKQSVMMDPSLAPFVDRFVWLEVDTDKPVNASLLTRLHIDVWPTFYVLSPEDESVQSRHLGAASIAQMRELLVQGEAGHQDAMARSGKLTAGSPMALARAGDRAAAGGDLKAAAKAYGEALAAAPPGWPRTADLLVKQIAALSRSGDQAGCADLGMREASRAAEGKTASVTDFSYYADECADKLDEARARLLRGRLVEAVRAVVDAPDSALSIDDQSDALLCLRGLAEKLGDPATAHAMAVRQRDLLDRAVAGAKTPLGRMTYVWPRSEVYVYLGEGKKLIADLEKLMADLPEEYDPPYRLAWVRLQIGELDQALPAAERAVGMVYGPRKGRALAMVADIHKARGDLKAERAARRAVVDFYASLPPGHRSDSSLAAARQALAAVGKPAKKTD